MAKKYYPDFGIVYKKGAYKLPNDQNERLQALNAILTALDTHGLSTKKFGKTY